MRDTHSSLCWSAHRVALEVECCILAVGDADDEPQRHSCGADDEDDSTRRRREAEVVAEAVV